MGRMNDLEAPMTVLFVEESASRAERFTFTATGAAYFRIWIVNLLLNIVSCGILAPWGKARRLRYFYGNTRIGSSAFAWQGSPAAILRGRLVLALFTAATLVSWNIAPGLGLVLVMVLAALLPWLSWKSLQYTLHHSSYRGIRFGFGGAPVQVYGYHLALPLLALCTLSVLAPLALQRLHKFRHEESHFGATYFVFGASLRAYARTCFLAAAVAVAGLAALVWTYWAVFGAIADAGGLKQAEEAVRRDFLILVCGCLTWCCVVVGTCSTLLQNLAWNHARLGGHQLRCDLHPARTAWIAFTNLLGIILSFGLYVPFARVRMLRHRIEAMTLIPAGSLEAYIQTTQSIVRSGAATTPLEFDLSL